MMTVEATHKTAVRSMAELASNMTKSHKPIFLEVGCGQTTFELAREAIKLKADFYSLDIDQRKIDQTMDDEIVFEASTMIQGDSLKSIKEHILPLSHLTFVFLDGAPSAMQTFKEFQLIEHMFIPESILLIDNACFPDTDNPKTACRKGKILVPYLLAAPDWQVFNKPGWGDSMVVAIHTVDTDYRHPDYENLDYKV